jgi:hypothetical protein
MTSTPQKITFGEKRESGVRRGPDRRQFSHAITGR